MALASEVQSLNDIQYKHKYKWFLNSTLGMFLFVAAFVNFYPIGDIVKDQVKKALPRGCRIDYREMHVEWFMPKLVITDLVVPPGCRGEGAAAALNFSHVNVNWHLISFAPFGLPFKLETNFEGQPIEVYFVQGLGEQRVRMIDQKLSLSKLKSLFGNKEIQGHVIVDMTLGMTDGQLVKVDLKAQSEDLVSPAMNLLPIVGVGLDIPPVKMNKFFLAAATNDNRVLNVEKIIVGDMESEIRASFKGKISLKGNAVAQSPLNLTGELAFSESFLKKFPVGMVFNSYTQKDGFYQMQIGGILGAPAANPL